MFTFSDLIDLLELSDLDAEQKNFVKVNIENLHNVFKDKYGCELVL